MKSADSGNLGLKRQHLPCTEAVMLLLQHLSEQLSGPESWVGSSGSRFLLTGIGIMSKVNPTVPEPDLTPTVEV
jgi:hypothetical protein